MKQLFFFSINSPKKLTQRHEGTKEETESKNLSFFLCASVYSTFGSKGAFVRNIGRKAYNENFSSA